MIAKVLELLSSGRDLARERACAAITTRKPLPHEVADWRVLFCGASVGYAWRLGLVYPHVRTLTAYSFDKSELVGQALSERPEAIVLKECAAYFPKHGAEASGDRERFAGWVQQIRDAGPAPIIATAVPVTRAHAGTVPGRAEAIWAFNTWLRRLATELDVTLLDLERALRISSNDRHLRDGLDDGDGLHLRRSTYRECLDHLMPIALMQAYLQTRAR